MAKNLSLSILLLILTACGIKENPKPQDIRVDPAFETILDQYKMDKLAYTGSDQIRPITILFKDLQKIDAEGQCVRSGQYRTIFIDPVFWEHSSYYDKIVVFYHEMGHCDLDIWEHVHGSSIMNASGIWSLQFAAQKNYYLNLLFNKGL